MINIDLGKVEVEGPKAVVMLELTILVSELRKVLSKIYGEEVADKQILHCIELSKLTAEEIDAENRFEDELIRRFFFGGGFECIAA